MYWEDLKRNPDIYLVTVVTHDLSVEPFALEVKTFAGVRQEALLLGPAGLAVCRNPPGRLPRYLDYRLLLIESDGPLRAAAAVLEGIHGDDQFKNLAGNLASMAAGAAAPATALIKSAADVAAGVIARLLEIPAQPRSSRAAARD